MDDKREACYSTYFKNILYSFLSGASCKIDFCNIWVDFDCSYLILANGCLDGVVGNDGDRHVVRGRVEKQTYKREEYKGDTLIEREIETYKVSLRILKKDGDIITLI